MKRTLLTKTIADAPEWYRQSTLRNFERMTFENDSDFLEWLEEVKDAADNIGEDPNDEKTEEYYRKLFSDELQQNGVIDLDNNNPDEVELRNGATDLDI